MSSVILNYTLKVTESELLGMSYAIIHLKSDILQYFANNDIP